MILFVNGCVRSNSRTLELAKAVLGELSGEVREVRLYPDGPDGLDGEKLALRDAFSRQIVLSQPGGQIAVEAQLAEGSLTGLSMSGCVKLFDAKTLEII